MVGGFGRKVRAFQWRVSLIQAGVLKRLSWAKMAEPPAVFLHSSFRPLPQPSVASRVLVRETRLRCKEEMLAGIFHPVHRPMKAQCKIHWLPSVSLRLRVPVSSVTCRPHRRFSLADSTKLETTAPTSRSPAVLLLSDACEHLCLAPEEPSLL